MTPAQFNVLVTAAGSAELAHRNIEGLGLQCCRGGDCVKTQMDGRPTPSERRRIKGHKPTYEEIRPALLCINCAARWHALMLCSTMRRLMLLEGKYQPQ